jgi:putative nucleotidyltransferase with HDIG domain
MINIDKGLAELMSAIPDILELEGYDLYRHSLTVAYLSSRLCSEIDAYKESETFLAGLLHDIGTFDIPFEAIHAKDLYSEISDKKVLSHPLISAQIVSSVSGLAKLADIVLAHHERFDGLGYPMRRIGQSIPEEAQIVRLVDSLSSKFNHSKQLDVNLALDYLQKQSDKEFKAAYLNAVKKMLNDANVIEKINNFDSLIETTNQMFDHFKSVLAKSQTLTVEEILFFFGQLLDAKHSYSEGHCIRVANYAVLIGLNMGLELRAIDGLRVAGLLHDIGKLGIPKNILDKSGKLTDEEFAVIQNHPDFAVRIIQKISFLKDILPIIQSDQEHWDGTGYPKKLKGGEIPLLARILLIADAFDAMTSDRAYRKAMPINDALTELQHCAGTDFDPSVIKVACEVFKNLNIPKPPAEKSF